MKVDKILEYQKLDSELYKIERQIADNTNKKKANELHENMKNAQSRSMKLEDKAGQLLAEIDKVKKQCKTQEDKLNEFIAMDLSKMSKADLDKLNALKEKLSQNLNILEKNLSALAENMNAVLADFNKTIKTFNNARDEYSKSKNAYEQEVKNKEKDKEEISKKLIKLASDIDSDIMEAYKRRRLENVFPVLVPLRDNFCGGCNTELPLTTLTTLKKDGIATCEHCRRLVYNKE